MMKNRAEDNISVNPSEEKILKIVSKSIEIFYLKEQEKVLTYREFLWAQFCMTQKKWWVLQILLLTGIGLALASNQEKFFVQRGLGIASVLFVILIIPELWKNRSNQCMEVESASYYSLRQIYSARLFLFGLVDVILLSAFCLFLHGNLHLSVLALISQFFFPAVVTACICFGALCNSNGIDETISIVFCILWSIAWWLITANERIYLAVKLPVWTGLTGIALLILGSMIYKTVRDCTQCWEECSDGTANN